MNVDCKDMLEEEVKVRLFIYAEDCDVSDMSEEDEEKELFTEIVKEESVSVELATEKKEEEDGNEDVTLRDGRDDEEMSPSI